MKNYLKSIAILTSLFINQILSINLQKPQCNKNMQILSCKDCKHFILDKENIELGKCDITYLTSLVTGQKIYNYAILNRMNLLNCGPNGKFYEYIIDPMNIYSDNLQKDNSISAAPSRACPGSGAAGVWSLRKTPCKEE